MDRPSDSPPSRRWGFIATCLLGIAALLGTLLAGADRLVGPGAANTDNPSGPSLTLAEPDRVVTVRRSAAVRVDTFPEVLSADDAVEIDGGWVILDPSARRIHVVPDDATRPLRSFAREGDGPGELSQPYRIAVSGSTLAVVEATGSRLVRYGLDGSLLGPVELAREGCGFGPARGVAADPGGGFLVLRTCTGLDGAMRALLLGIDPAGRVRIVVDRRLQSLKTDAVDPYAMPVLGVHEGAAYLGTLSAGCLERLYDAGGSDAPVSLCAPPGSGVPLPDSIRAGFERLEERMTPIGGRVVVPREFPPFLDVRTTAAGTVLVVPLAGGRKALDLVRARGRRTRFDVDVPGRTYVGRRHLLLVEPLLEGTEVAWVARDG